MALMDSSWFQPQTADPAGGGSWLDVMRRLQSPATPQPYQFSPPPPSNQFRPIQKHNVEGPAIDRPRVPFPKFDGAQGPRMPRITDGSPVVLPPTTPPPGGGGTGGGGGVPGGGGLPGGGDLPVQPGFGIPGGPFSLGDPQFTDPDTLRLLEYVTARIQQLTAPQTDPSMDAYVGAAQHYAQNLMNPTGDIQSIVRQVLGQVTGDPFSASDLAGLRAEAFDSLEQERQNAIRQETARLARLGHGPGSGTLTEAIRRVNEGFDQQRSQRTRDLNIAGIEQANRNRGTALSIADTLRGFGREGVGALGAVSDARAGQRSENEARLNQALTLMGLPIQLSDQRLQQAMAVLGLSPSPGPTDIFNSLANFSTQTSALNQQNRQNQSAFWSSLGQLLPSLLQGFGNPSTAAA